MSEQNSLTPSGLGANFPYGSPEFRDCRSFPLSIVRSLAHCPTTRNVSEVNSTSAAFRTRLLGIHYAGAQAVQAAAAGEAGAMMHAASGISIEIHQRYIAGADETQAPGPDAGIRGCVRTRRGSGVNMPNEKRAIRSRLDFSKIPTATQIPNLIEVQRRSLRAVPADGQAAQRARRLGAAVGVCVGVSRLRISAASRSWISWTSRSATGSASAAT